MIRLILNDDQSKAVENAASTMEIRDATGRLLGYLQPSPSDARIAAAKERAKSDGPWRTTDQVIDRLQSLEQE